MKCKFVPGQKVVCVINREWIAYEGRIPNIPLPKRGDIVTVKKLHTDVAEKIEVGISLKEYPDHIHFAHYDFRPLNEKPKETSIEVFKKLLTPTQKFVKERV